MFAIFPAIEDASVKEEYLFLCGRELVAWLAPIDAANVAPNMLLRLQIPTKSDSVQNEQNTQIHIVWLNICMRAYYVCILYTNLSYLSRCLYF